MDNRKNATSAPKRTMSLRPSEQRIRAPSHHRLLLFPGRIVARNEDRRADHWEGIQSTFGNSGKHSEGV